MPYSNCTPNHHHHFHLLHLFLFLYFRWHEIYILRMLVQIIWLHRNYIKSLISIQQFLYILHHHIFGLLQILYYLTRLCVTRVAIVISLNKLTKLIKFFLPWVVSGYQRTHSAGKRRIRQSCRSRNFEWISSSRQRGRRTLIDPGPLPSCINTLCHFRLCNWTYTWS